jgi:hypothetical protein
MDMCPNAIAPGAGSNVISDFESAHFVSIRICEWHLFSSALRRFLIAVSRLEIREVLENLSTRLTVRRLGGSTQRP